MTGQDIMEAFEKWKEQSEVQTAIALHAQGGEAQRRHFEIWLQTAWVCGAAEVHKDKEKPKLLWPDSAEEAERTRLHALGVTL